MNGLSNDVLEKIKALLIEQKTAAQKRIEELKAQDPFADPEHSNDNAASDREASEEEGHDRVQAMLTELTESLQAIDAAMDRIQKGTYGLCESCGEVIDSARLEAFPTATMCISCQSKGTN